MLYEFKCPNDYNTFEWGCFYEESYLVFQEVSDPICKNKEEAAPYLNWGYLTHAHRNEYVFEKFKEEFISKYSEKLIDEKIAKIRSLYDKKIKRSKSAKEKRLRKTSTQFNILEQKEIAQEVLRDYLQVQLGDVARVPFFSPPRASNVSLCSFIKFSRASDFPYLLGAAEGNIGLEFVDRSGITLYNQLGILWGEEAPNNCLERFLNHERGPIRRFALRFMDSVPLGLLDDDKKIRYMAEEIKKGK